MNKWPGAPFWGSLHPEAAQNKILKVDVGVWFEFLKSITPCSNQC